MSTIPTTMPTPPVEANTKDKDNGSVYRIMEYACGHKQPMDFACLVDKKAAHYQGSLCCPTCETGKRTLVEEILSNDALLNTMRSKFGTLEMDWPDCGANVKCIDVATLPQRVKVFPKHLLECKDLRRFLSGSFKVRHLALDVEPPDKVEQGLILGGKHPNCFAYPDNQLLRNPGDGSVGLVSWKNGAKNFSGRDYAFIGSVGLSNECIKRISIDESKYIHDMVKDKRMGSAGGYYLPTQNRHFDSLYLAPCTKETREFTRGPRVSSTGCAVTYTNYKKSRDVTYASCYNDLLMRKIDGNKGEMRQLLLASPAERERAIKEMEFRIKCLLAVDLFGLESTHATWMSFKGAVNAALGSPYTDEQDTWTNIQPPIPLWHRVLLEFACCGCNVRNHQAVAAHIDGNPNHFLEGMMLFPVVAANCEAPSSRLVNNSTPGILCLPLMGVAFEISCGRDGLQLQLANTIHIADSSRGSNNVSTVST